MDIKRTVTGRTPSEPEIQNIKPRNHSKSNPYFGIQEAGSFQQIERILLHHPKLTFLDAINDGKRLDVWKNDFKMVTEIEVGKYSIDQIISRRNSSLLEVLNAVSKVKMFGDIK